MPYTSGAPPGAVASLPRGKRLKTPFALPRQFIRGSLVVLGYPRKMESPRRSGRGQKEKKAGDRRCLSAPAP